MKKVFLVILILSAFLLLFSKQMQVSNYDNSITVLHSNNTETLIDYKIGSINVITININGEKYNKINVKNGHYLYKKGAPDLPAITKSIIIPNTAKMEVEIISSEYKDYKFKIAPSKGKIFRNQNPENIPYMFSDIYKKNEFYPKKQTYLGTPYILRDFRGITVTVIPFAYNPITNTLRVYTHMKIKIKNIGTDKVNLLSKFKNSYSAYFKTIYQAHFINFDSMKYPLVDEHGRMIVICYPDFLDAIQPYVEWKKQKGIDVQVYNVDDIGNANAIKNFIQEQYDQNDDLTFIQLVGDAPQVPTLTSNGGGADPKYALVAGNDAYMDIFVGRFSAETIAQVETQVERSVWYERDIQDGDWIQKGIGIASSQGTGDDNEYDYQHEDVIREKLLNYGYTQVDQLYDTVNVTAQQVADSLNLGRGIVNYTGHGSDFSWASSGFDINDVNNLHNAYMLPFIQSVACVVGNFTNQTCFAEAWLRATDSQNGAPTGAIAFFGSSINQSWAPPMSAQDEYVDMITGSVNYAGTPEVMKTIGGLWFNGEGEMLDLYNDNAMSETWHIFGDASLMVRTKVPQPITVTHSGVLFLGMNTYNVSTDVPEAQVCLYANGQIYASGFTDDNGNIMLTLSNPPQTPMDLTLTVTAFNKITYIDQVNVVPNEGAYVMISSVEFTTDNGDNIIEYGETVNMNVTLQNIGNSDANNVVLSFQNTNAITFTTNSCNFGNIPAGDTITIQNCATFVVSNTVENNQSINIPYTINSNDGNWDADLPITVYAPVLSIANIVIDDSEGGNNNGRIDAGETVDLTIVIENTGGARLNDITANISSNDAYVTINQATANLDEIIQNSTGDLTFNISVSQETPIGYTIGFLFALSALHDFGYNTEFTQTVGLVLEDFETGDFSSYPWEFEGTQNWEVVNNNPYEGNYCAKSGAISNNQFSSLKVTLNVLDNNEISFYYKVSSEESYDFLKFFIDNSEMDSWSGEIDWTQAIYDVSPGIHTFEWKYIKDSSVSQGNDCGWIDYIVFPPIGEIIPPNLVVSPDSFYVNLPENGTLDETLTLTNDGGGEIQYTIGIYNSPDDRNIEGSTLTCDTQNYTPGLQYDLSFTATNNSDDQEWLTDISIAFPAGVVVNSSTDFVGGSSPLVTHNETGDGVTVTWYNADGGFGNIHDGETATATVNITVSSGFSGDMILNWHMVGDQWGDPPHELDGQVILSQEGETISWINLSQTSGTLGEGETDNIIVSFNSNGLELGNIYTCELRISDNLGRNITTIPVVLNYGGVSGNIDVIPMKTELIGNYPNPFNPTTAIKFALNKDQMVSLKVYNMKGQLVKNLHRGIMKAGYYRMVWDGKNDYGKKLSSGVYFYKLQAGKYTSVKKMILLK